MQCFKVVKLLIVLVSTFSLVISETWEQQHPEPPCLDEQKIFLKQMTELTTIIHGLIDKLNVIKTSYSNIFIFGLKGFERNELLADLESKLEGIRDEIVKIKQSEISKFHAGILRAMILEYTLYNQTKPNMIMKRRGERVPDIIKGRVPYKSCCTDYCVYAKDCPGWSNYCVNPIETKFMHRNCKKTCRKC